MIVENVAEVANERRTTVESRPTRLMSFKKKKLGWIKVEKWFKKYLARPVEYLVTLQWLPFNIKLTIVCLLYITIASYLVLSLKFVLMFEFLDKFTLPDKIFDMPVTCNALNSRYPKCYCSLVTFDACEGWLSRYNATMPLGQEQQDYGYQRRTTGPPMHPIPIDDRVRYSYFRKQPYQPVT